MMLRLARCLPLALLSMTMIVAPSAHADDVSLDELSKAARQEGQVNSVGMPDSWANWKETWADLHRLYGLSHSDTDMSSAEEVAKMKAEGDNATADMGDVGIEFGPIAKAQGVTQPYKPSTWAQIPDWAKDPDGHWVLGYTGTIALIVNNQRVPKAQRPTSFADLLKGHYQVAIGPVGKGTQSNSAVLAAAIARGGDENHLDPGIALFAELARQKRLSLADPSLANLEKGEIEVALLWDFNALNYRDQIDPARFSVVIPSDGSVTSGYATIINRHARHPNAAKLAREYILSDAGQINLARGYARPIRARYLTLPDDVASRLLPDEAYASARPVHDFAAWDRDARELAQRWQSEVLINR